MSQEILSTEYGNAVRTKVSGHFRQCGRLSSSVVKRNFHCIYSLSANCWHCHQKPGGHQSVLPSILKRYWPPYPFGVDFSLKWDGGGAKTVDVDTSPTQNVLSQYAFNFRLGRTLGIFSAFDSIIQVIICCYWGEPERAPH